MKSMEDNYQYLDSDNKYTNKKGVLKNKAQIEDEKVLLIYESLKVSKRVEELLETVNFLHPFREGNGRTQREFIRLLALEKKIKLNLNPPDNKKVYEQYMVGTINSDIELLSELILDLISGNRTGHNI
jgi:cell filamentation protein